MPVMLVNTPIPCRPSPCGLENRRRSSEEESPRVYACAGLRQAMQAELGCTREQLSHVIRIMRADLAVWSTHTWDGELARQFRAAAALFLRVHGPRSWRVFWHRNDPVNYAGTSTRSMGSTTPCTTRRARGRAHRGFRTSWSCFGAPTRRGVSWAIHSPRSTGKLWRGP